MNDLSREEILRRIDELTKVLTEREAPTPIHSIRPHQLIQIQELEEEIERLKTDRKYIASIAREKLGMIGNNEVIYRFNE